LTPQSTLVPLVISAISSEFAGWLKDARLKPWQNYAIVCFFFVIAVALSVIADGGLTGNPGTDIGIILAECTAVFAALKPLRDDAMARLRSPIGAMVAEHQRLAEMERDFEERLAAARASVPPRASASGVVEGSGHAMPSQPGIAPEPPMQPQ
jgi:hypothetical protein